MEDDESLGSIYFTMRLLMAAALFLAVYQGYGGAFAFEVQDCMACHGDESIAKASKEERSAMVIPLGKEEAEKFKARKPLKRPSPYIDPAVLGESVHSGLSCTLCHADIESLPHKAALAEVNCGECHAQAQKEYGQSLHAQAFREGDQDVPLCRDCHGVHDIKSGADPKSKTNTRNLAKTCAACHADQEVVGRRKLPIGEVYKAYERSVHGRAVEKRGIVVAAVCNDCHGTHLLLPPTDARSQINRFNIPKTCSNCHYGTFELYRDSVHGAALRHGVSDVPVCTDCHGEHEILAPEEPRSLVYTGEIAKTTCPRCHSAERIIRKYGLPSNAVQTYKDSYHGLADQLGITTVANCASCHGVHDIRPQKDPLSSINPANLPRTCGKCHPGSGAAFAIGPIHMVPTEEQNPIIFYVRKFYIILIILVVGSMALHNLADYLKKVAQTYGQERSKPSYERFTINEVVQHWIIIASFAALVVTGFALKFPNAFWVRPFHQYPTLIGLRGDVHRGAAVVMMGLCLYHFLYLLLTERGRSLARAMFPDPKDMADFFGIALYYLGLRNKKPEFDRFSYIEKAEYLALIWGSIVMIVTGLILWFEEQALLYLPKWAFNVAELVHYYEAWLALLAIVVWHLYWVWFNPEVSPMNFSWLSGKLSEEKMKHEHPGELRRAKRPKR